MTDTLTMVTMPALGAWPNVEIAQTGQWKISTGEVTLTLDDFSNALAALECPAIHKPVIKLGHKEGMPDANKKRTDGEPAIGFIDNMATADKGHTMVGDYTGMPGWLGAILPSAYPERSMEATWDFVCQLGHLHPFVITAVALLGVTPPGIGTLDTLADVANLYGVMASAPVSAGFSVSIKAGDAKMPNPQSTQVAAGITTEDVRRQYYDSGVAYTTWIKEMSLDPLQLITVDEATGEYARVPITLTSDGATFGDAVPVEVEYVDAPATAAASRMVYASKDESRAGFTSRVEKDLPPVAAIQRVHKAATVAKEGQGTMTDMVKLREALGLPADASDDQVNTAYAAAFPATPPATEPVTPVAAATPTPSGPLPEGTMLLDSSVVKRLQEGAAQGIAAMAAIQKNTRDTVIAAAIADGKFPPSRKEHYELMWDGDPVGTESHIKRLAAGVIPLQASGYAGTETYEDDMKYYGLYPEDRPAKAV